MQAPRTFVLAAGLALLACVVLSPTTGLAQAPTTGSINGTVTDDTGGVLPGVTVTVSGPALMGTQTTVTNDQGQYRFPALNVGTYRLTYELPGFATVIREGIQVSIGFTATVNIQMAVAAVEETVTVTGASPVVDVQNTNIQNVFNAEMLRSIPNQRDIWGLIAVAPGTTVDRFDVGGSSAGTQTGYTAYGTSGQVRIQIDGVNTTEGTGGSAFYYDYGAFDEVQLGTDSNDASMPTPGVFLNTVLKSGGNEFRGETYVDFAQLRGGMRNDLSNRDFTINAMARRLGSNELVDPFHGERDLSDKKIRAVSDNAFKDDPVRLLRAVRFAGELHFTIDAHTEELVRRDAKLLAYAPMERARDEWCKILTLSNPTKWLRLADSLGLVDSIIPEISALKTTNQSLPHVFNVFDHTLRVLDEVETIQSNNYAEVAGGKFIVELQSHLSQPASSDHTRSTIFRMATLLHDIGKPMTQSADRQGAVHFYEHEARGAEMSSTIMRRLRFSNDEVELVAKIVLHHLRPSLLADEPKVTNRAIYRFFRDASDAGIDVCVLALADRRGTYAAEANDKHDSRLRSTLALLLDRYYSAPRTVVTPPSLIDGRDLMSELHLSPGPRIGELLEAIREAQAEGEVKTRVEAMAYAVERLKAKG